MKTIYLLLVCAASLVTYASAMGRCDMSCSMLPPPIRHSCMRSCEQRRFYSDLQQELDIDPEDFKLYGNAANGGQWNVGFEYTSKDEDEAEEEDWEELIDPEDLSIHGNVGNGGQWNLGFKYEIKDDSAEEEFDPEDIKFYGNAANDGKWNVGFEYTSKDGEEEEAEDWEEVDPEDLSIVGNVGNRGNWNVGIQYSTTW